MDSKNSFEKLKELLDMQLLNEKEYQSKRKNILNNLIENLEKKDYSEIEILKENLLQIKDLLDAELINEDEFELMRSLMVANKKDKVENPTINSNVTSYDKKALSTNENLKELKTNKPSKSNSDIFFSKKNTKKIIILFSIIYAVLLIFTSYNYFSFVSKAYRPSRDDLLEMRSHSYFMPFTFLNSSQLRNELDFVESAYRYLNVSYFGEGICYSCFDDELEKLPEARNTLNRLIDFDNKNSTWDLANVTRDTSVFLINKSFYNGQYYFSWTYNSSTEDFRFGSNLPSKRTSYTNYFYSWKYNGIMAYVNKDDETDTFYAYSITIIDDNTISVYCYSNGQTYELSTDY